MHGDFHQDNILSAQREPYLAIDPKSTIGEPAYDLGAFLCSPVSEILQSPNPSDILKKRVDIFTEQTGVERTRIIKWGLVSAMLNAGGGYITDDPEWQNNLAVARLIESLELSSQET